MDKTKQEYTTQKFFQRLSFLFLAAIAGYYLLPYFNATAELGKNLPFVNNSAVKVALSWLLCIYIAGDIRKRKGLILIFIIGHILSVVSMLLYLNFADTSASFRLFDSTMTTGRFLWISIIVDVIVIVLATIYYLKVSDNKSGIARDLTNRNSPGFVHGLVIVCGILFLAAAVGYHIGPYINTTKDFCITLPMVSNSAIKVAFMGMLCIYIARNVHRNIPVLNIVIVGHIFSIIMQASYAILLNSKASLTIGTSIISEIQILWYAVILDLAITILLVVGYLKYWKNQFGKFQFLNPIEYRSLIALSEVVVEDPNDQELIDPQSITRKLDHYVEGMNARRKWIYHLMLYVLQVIPMFFGKAPLSELDYNNRKTFLKNSFQ